MTVKTPTTNRVRALFEDSSVIFDLPDDATLEELAAMLASVGRGHGAPLRVEVAVKPPG
jgi:hypothetical protein